MNLHSCDELDDINIPSPSDDTISKFVFCVYLHTLFLGTASGRVFCSMQKILELIGTCCHIVGCDCPCLITYKSSGCCMIVKGICRSGHCFNWSSSEVILNAINQKIYLDNLNVASAIVLSGNQFEKLILFCKFLNISFVKRSMFHTYQKLFICPGIKKFYKVEQVIYIYIHKHCMY